MQLQRTMVLPPALLFAGSLAIHIAVASSSSLWFSYRLIILSIIVVGFSAALVSLYQQGTWRRSQLVLALMLVIAGIVLQKAWLIGLTILSSNLSSPPFEMWLLGDEWFLILSTPLWLWLAGLWKGGNGPV